MAEHEHKWVHLSTHYYRESVGYQVKFTRCDVFYCEKCLEKKEVVQTEYAGRYDEIPLWWRH